MRTTKINIKGRDFRVPYPETMEDLESLVPNEGDRIELLRFAFYHRLRSTGGSLMKTRPLTHVQKALDNYQHGRQRGRIRKVRNG